MPDEIVGIAVLDRRERPWQLFVLCRCTTGPRAGHTLSTDIPVYGRGDRKELTHQWLIDPRPGTDWLAVTPSLNWVGVFHNSYSWQVRHVEFDPVAYPFPRAQLRALNPELVEPLPE